MTDLYMGLMSGTSVDGIDAALVDFTEEKPAVIATHYTPYPAAVREKIMALCQSGENEIERLGELDIVLGKLFAQTANDLLKTHAISAAAIQAIGSHGQSIRHAPYAEHRFTIQIGDPNTIAAETGITTVADFRRKDIALGGQGAPLVPAFHQHILSSTTNHRAILNIGGIANITILKKNHPGPIIGFDTGPGNVLMDMWIAKHQQMSHDKNGEWGIQGSVQTDLLNSMQSDPYFQLIPPKSTGREYFNLTWLQSHVDRLQKNFTPVDVQATLTELTACTILAAIQQHLGQGEILVCGGGAHNTLLMTRLTELAKPTFTVASTQKEGIDPDWMEAVAFAWLARQTLNRRPGNLPSVTGAKKAVVLGGVYYGS